MNITDQSYVAEWSHSQQHYHIHTVAEMLRHNNEQHNQNEGPDYIPLGFFGSSEDASKFIDSIQGKQRPKHE